MPIHLSKTVAVFNTPSAELTLGASTDPVTADETFTYLLDVGNISAGALGDTQLRVHLPTGVSVDAVSDGGTDLGTEEVVWDLGSVGVGVALHREVTVTADGGVLAGQILAAQATLTHTGGLAVDQVTEHAVTVTDSVLQLSVDVAASPNPTASSGALIYTITVTNDSAIPLNDVLVLLRVPAGLSYNRTADAEPNAGCVFVTCAAGIESPWDLGTLAASESVVITINATVDSGLVDGELIDASLLVTSSDLLDAINLHHAVVIQNP